MSAASVILRTSLWMKSRRGPLVRAMGAGRKISRPDPRVGVVRVAAVQMPFSFYRTGEAFARDVSRLARRAAEGGAELVVFPEDLGTMLLGLLPRFERIEALGSFDEALAALGDGVRVADVVELASPATLRIYRTVLSEVARSLGLLVQGGSIMVSTRDGRTFNQADLFGPKGRLLTTQRKCHLLPVEAEWGLAPGDDLDVVSTPLGMVAEPICMDATYFETFRILRSKGAEIVCLPKADPEPVENPWKSLRGLWPRVQESPMYGVAAAMVGGAMGLSFSGHAEVLAPLELTADGTGILARSEEEGEDVVLADLDMDALRAIRQDPAIRPNPAFVQAYFPGIYQGFWRGGAQR